MTPPEFKDDQITVTLPFQQWVEEVVHKAVDSAAKRITESCPYRRDIEMANEFIAKWNRRWYIMIGAFGVISLITNGPSLLALLR